jgi:hypothetical protein
MCMGEWRFSSNILNLFTRWKWVISFSPLQLYPHGQSLSYPLDTRLGRPHSQSQRYGKSLCSCRESKYVTSTFQPIAWSLHRLKNSGDNLTFSKAGYNIARWKFNGKYLYLLPPATCHYTQQSAYVQSVKWRLHRHSYEFIANWRGADVTFLFHIQTK